MDLQLRGKRALVSGGTQGIGRGIAFALAAEGASVFITARDKERLQETAQAIRDQHGVDCRWFSADYGSPQESEQAVESALEAFGGIDILVNNTGRNFTGTLDTPLEDWHQSLQINLLSHITAMKLLIPSMKANRWGRIINITGLASRYPEAVQLSSGPKLSLIVLAKVLSRDLATFGITVNSVTVGKIESYQMNHLRFPTEESRRVYAEREIPLMRFGLPEEVAPAVTFLASDQAKYITGSILTVDGGQSKAFM